MILNGMSQAITEGRIIDTKVMLAAMTEREKRQIITEAQASIENFERLVRISREADQ